MSLDEQLARSARRLADGVTPPDVDLGAVRARARSNRRRATYLAAVATVVAVVAVGATVIRGRTMSTPAPLLPSPSETVSSPSSPEPEPDGSAPGMTPEEVVKAPGAVLHAAAVAADDPDVRISVWSSLCRKCPEPSAIPRRTSHGRPTFTGMALTTDGYETSTYVPAPIGTIGVDLYVRSPRDGVFLLIDQSNGHEWLVDLDGTVRRVTRVQQEFSPTDPLSWFQCTGSWRQTWCSIDVDRATAYRWPKAWDGSAVRPGIGDAPWGAHPEPRAASTSGRLEAWWDSDRGRQVRTVAVARGGDYVQGTPPGEMAYWAPSPGGNGIDIHTSDDRGDSWSVESRDLPGDKRWSQVSRSPEGALLAYTTYPQLAVWRAEASGGPFRKVHELPPGSETGGAGMWTQSDLVAVAGMGAVAISTDDGRTFTTIRTWR